MLGEIEKEFFLLEHTQPNEAHPHTGYFLLWRLDPQGVKVNMVDYETYSVSPRNGPGEAYARSVLTDMVTRRGGELKEEVKK